METKDPNLTKNLSANDRSSSGVHPDKAPNNASSTDLNSGSESSQSEPKVTDKLESDTIHNKGTTTLKDEIMHSEHVKSGDNPARQPDRRDQQGETPFDDNLNDDTTLTEDPQSEEINDMNRYATVDNAQTRVLHEDPK